MIKLKKVIVGIILSLVVLCQVGTFACEDCDNIIGLINKHLNEKPTKKTNFELVDFFVGENRDCTQEINLDQLISMVSPRDSANLPISLPDDNSLFYRKLLTWTAKGGNIYRLIHNGIHLDNDSAVLLVSFSIKLD